MNESGSAGQYTALTAPLILPVNTPGYSAMAAPAGYSSSMGYGSISDYTNAGYQTSEPAACWRIRTGINQGDTALCTEINLALAAAAYSGETSVDFETVWGQGHTEAERTGSSTENFIAWVNACMK